EWYVGGRSSVGKGPFAHAPRPHPRRAPGMARAAFFSSQVHSSRKGAKAARRASVILLLGGLLVMQEQTGIGQTKDTESPPRHVEIKTVAPSDSWPALQAVLSELLARLKVSVRFSTVPGVETRQIMTERSDDPPSVARVWIDMRDSGRVTLYL